MRMGLPVHERDDGREKIRPSFDQILSTNVDNLTANTLGSVEGQVLEDSQGPVEEGEDRILTTFSVF
jgi:hypothetical protein